MRITRMIEQVVDVKVPTGIDHNTSDTDIYACTLSDDYKYECATIKCEDCYFCLSVVQAMSVSDVLTE